MKKHLNTTNLVLSKNIMLFAVVLLLLIIGVIASQPKFFLRMVKDSQMIYTPIGHKWHKIDLRRFSLNTPEEYQYVREQGIDSYVGVITNGADTIYFDYGWYSNNLNDAAYLRSYDTINGVPAIIAYSSTSHVGVHFPQIVDQNKLTLFSKTLTKELAYQIFKSIKFPGHSGRTTEVLGQNTVNEGFAPGK